MSHDRQDLPGLVRERRLHRRAPRRDDPHGCDRRRRLPGRAGRVGLEFSEVDQDEAPSLVLHLDSAGHDVDVLLCPEEARALVEQLLSRLDVWDCPDSG